MSTPSTQRNVNLSINALSFDHRAASGIQAQRYLAEHGLTGRDLARVAATRWRDAASRGKVRIASSPSEDEILASLNVAAPLTQYMLSRPVDGAVAILLAREDIARRASRSPVWVTGLGASADRHSFAARNAGRLEACEVAARSACK
jgi:acetyl-CoA C-acetyltransferase